MKICQDHDKGRSIECSVVWVVRGDHMEGDCPICEELKEKDLEIDQLKQQIDVLEDEIANLK